MGPAWRSRKKKGGKTLKSISAFRQPVHSLSVVIPFFNEEEAIDQLRERLSPVLERLGDQLKIQLILVDDGSTDRTYDLLRQRFRDLSGGEVVFIRHPANRGISAAMRTGFAAAGGDVICTMDSDCTYDPAGIPEMVELLQAHNADIVTASPYHPAVPQAGQPRRIFLSKGASWIYSLLIPQKLYCYTSFFRLYRRPWSRGDAFTSDGFLGVTEILLSAAYCGATIVEYPTHLATRTVGRSKMRTLQVIRDHLQLMWKSLRLNLHLGLARDLPRPPEGPAEGAAALPRPANEDVESLLAQWMLIGRIESRTRRQARAGQPAAPLTG